MHAYRREADTTVLRFIAGYQDHHDGISPTLQECAAALGLRSRTCAYRAIVRLEAAGLLRRLPGRTRAVWLTRRVAIPRAPDGAPLYCAPVNLMSHERSIAQEGQRNHV